MPPPFSNSELRTIGLGDLGGGLLSDVSPQDIPMGSASACSNYVFLDGYLRPRAGLGKYDAPAYGYTSTNFPAGEELVHISPYTYLNQNSGELVYSLMRVTKNPNGFLSIYQLVPEGSWVLLGSGIPSYGIPGYPVNGYIPICSATWKQNWWFTTGLSVYQYSAATGFIINVDTMQNNPVLKIPGFPRIMVAGDSRLFIADCSADYTAPGRVPYRIAWSDFLDGTVWNSGINAGTSGYVDLPGETSEAITGLYYSGSVLMAFQPSAIYLGISAGPPMVFDFRQHVTGVGCISHRTIKRYRDGWVLWLGDDNVYRGGTDRAPEAIGDHIRPRLREIADLVNLNRAVASIDRTNHLYTIFIPYSSDSDVMVMFTVNLRNGSWWEGRLEYTGANIRDTWEFREGPWTTRQLLADADGRLYNMDFAHTKDGDFEIQSMWTSGVISVPVVAQGSTDQASLQMIRAYAPYGRVHLGAYAGDCLDRFTHYPYGEQIFDHKSSVMTTARPPSAEQFKVTLNSESATTGAKISKISVGAILEGPTRR